MKAVTVALAGIILVGGHLAFAEGDDAGENRGKDRPEGIAAGQMKEEMLKKFDKDGDGQLSEVEKQAAHEAMKARMKRGKEGENRPPRNPAEMQKTMLERFDKDGDGQLSEAEKEAARQAGAERREFAAVRMLQELDTDGDGELSEVEKEAARQALAGRIEQFKTRMLEMFDKDGDGQLSEEERARAREMMQRRIREGAGRDGEKPGMGNRDRKEGEHPGKGKGHMNKGDDAGPKPEEAPPVHVEI